MNTGPKGHRAHKGRASPAVLQLNIRGIMVKDVAGELKCHPSYVSHALSGQDPYPDRLHDTLMEMVGVEAAVTIRALAAQVRTEKQAAITPKQREQKLAKAREYMRGLTPEQRDRRNEQKRARYQRQKAERKAAEGGAS